MSTSAIIDHLAKGAAKELELLKSYIGSVYQVSKKGTPEQIGTGTFIVIGNTHLLITAAHVLDEQDKSGSTLYLAGGKIRGLIQLTGSSFRTDKVAGDREHDHNDIAGIEIIGTLLDSIGEDAFLKISQVDVNDIGRPGIPYMALGYPCTKNKELNLVKHSFKRSLLGYTSILKFLEPSARCKCGTVLNRASHLLLGFKKKKSGVIDGPPTTAPDIHGMSGGALWRFDYPPLPPGTSKMVGMLIEWRRELGAILVVRMPLILEAIRNRYPHLSAEIPRTTTITIGVNRSKSKP